MAGDSSPPAATVTMPPIQSSGASVTITFIHMSQPPSPYVRVIGPANTDTNIQIPLSGMYSAYATYTWIPDENMVHWEIPALKTKGDAKFTEGNESPSAIATSNTPTTTTSAGITSSPASTPVSTGSGSTQTNPSPTLTPTPPPAKDGLSSGAVAGIAIGCLIAGALIAGLLAWFFWKRRKPAGMRDSEASTVALMHREKGPPTKAQSLESGSPLTSTMENGLPQPLEDKAISGEISKISNLIKNHVQSYYHSGRVNPISIDYDDIQALGGDLPVSVGTLSTLLGNAATREIAVRFCIAWVVVSRMQLKSSPSTTFLPPEISQCIQGMSYADRAHAMFFAKWRAITAELLQSTYVRNPFSASDPRLQNIQAVADTLDNVIRPYSDSHMDNGQRSRNLEEILKRATQFAFALFSQPSSWDFDWQSELGVKSGSLCIFPALMQVADENGEPIKPPRPFSEAVVRRLDD